MQEVTWDGFPSRQRSRFFFPLLPQQESDERDFAHFYTNEYKIWHKSGSILVMTHTELSLIKSVWNNEILFTICVVTLLLLQTLPLSLRFLLKRRTGLYRCAAQLKVVFFLLPPFIVSGFYSKQMFFHGWVCRCTKYTFSIGLGNKASCSVVSILSLFVQNGSVSCIWPS